jgi:pSer/pThr/pTyr-binding forkhead associated (FHA) protein
MAKLTLTFKGHVMDVFHIEKNQTVIGRNQDCTIPIDSLAIAPAHAMITCIEDQKYLLKALDKEFPVLVNHETVEAAPLHHGDVIQIGKHTLAFAEDVMDLGANISDNLFQPAPPTHHETNETDENSEFNPLSGILQIIVGDDFGRVIPLKRTMTRIGHAGSDCAMIVRREEGYFISFLEGHNHPQVNHEPINNQTQRLSDGDIIDIGGTQMQFHISK